jgi:SAM-dependent methyltransferase
MRDLAGQALYQVGSSLTKLAIRTGYGKWDRAFRRWIAEAQASGGDPNDFGDKAWANDYLTQCLDSRYLAYVTPGSTVLELGPGSGRLTRHLVGRVGRLELVDNSPFVIEWISKYLEGKVPFRAQRITTPSFDHIVASSIDSVLAHGVFEHLDFDETFFFLAEFCRVLRPGGYASFNYNTLHSPAGEQWFHSHRGEPGDRCIFRFYTPDFMQRIAEIAGLQAVTSEASDERLAHIVLKRFES